MENYQGVKFSYHKSATHFAYDQRLTTLNRWAYIFSELGLTPVHPEGAYGNQSYRTGKSSFLITKSGMKPEEKLLLSNYTHVLDFKKSSSTFIVEGQSTPSSECFLHNALYQALPDVNAILHGHCSLFNVYASQLSIPVTKTFQEYGTQELAESALELVSDSTNFFILRDHGFVTLAEDIDSAARVTLDYYSNLIALLRSH